MWWGKPKPETLIEVAERGDEKEIARLIATGASLDAVDRGGSTALMRAAHLGHDRVIALLLRSGAAPNFSDGKGWTALHFAAQGQHVAAVEALLGGGADPNAQDNYGNSPLARAVFTANENGAVIRLLRAAGADARLANHSGVSALDLARKIANVDVKQFFSDLA